MLTLFLTLSFHIADIFRLSPLSSFHLWHSLLSVGLVHLHKIHRDMKSTFPT